MPPRRDSIVCLNQQPDHANALICIGHAGAGISAFNSWRNWPSRTTSVWAARLPGRESRISEKPLTAIDAMADSLFDDASHLSADRIVVFGHCSGALVAYELACRLAARGKPALRLALVVSSQPFPLTPDAGYLAISGLPLAELISELRKIGGMTDAVLADNGLMTLLAPGIRADFQAAGNYTYPIDRPAPEFPIAAFGGKRDVRIRAAELTAWRAATAGKFKMRLFEGGHFYLYEQGQAVRAALEELLSAS
jgi:medium-chain acyl-[acyl-carrier-protein] hydrolase